LRSIICREIDVKEVDKEKEEEGCIKDGRKTYDWMEED
jgi:hypothetical protein